MIGDPSVPVGSYTQAGTGPPARAPSAAILANVRSEEPEVSAVVAKLDAGAADAGFVYVTDVEAAAGELRAVPLPAAPAAEDRLRGGGGRRQRRARQLAQRYLDGLLEGEGQAELRRAGFRPPPMRRRSIFGFVALSRRWSCSPSS